MCVWFGAFHGLVSSVNHDKPSQRASYAGRVFIFVVMFVTVTCEFFTRKTFERDTDSRVVAKYLRTTAANHVRTNSTTNPLEYPSKKIIIVSNRKTHKNRFILRPIICVQSFWFTYYYSTIMCFAWTGKKLCESYCFFPW